MENLTIHQLQNYLSLKYKDVTTSSATTKYKLTCKTAIIAEFNFQLL